MKAEMERPYVDFNKLHPRITDLILASNEQFETEWPQFIKDLKFYTDAGQLETMHTDQIDIICMDLEVLGNKFSGQRDEIQKIASQLEISPETRALLETIRAESKKPLPPGSGGLLDPSSK